MNFSASQILCHGSEDVGTLLQCRCGSGTRTETGLFRRAALHAVCLIVHDHAYGGVPEPGCGVVVRFLTEPEVLRWLPLNGSPPPARLETTISGASMATGIQETAFDADAFCRTVHGLQEVGRLPERARMAAPPYQPDPDTLVCELIRPVWADGERDPRPPAQQNSVPGPQCPLASAKPGLPGGLPLSSGRSKKGKK